MTRATTCLAPLAIVLFATSGFALAGGGRHCGYHGHHHSGFHFSFRHGLHHYGHHYHYPYYRCRYYSYPRSYRYYSYSRYYRYSYPSCRSYSYYCSPSCYAPTVIYIQPARKTYSPQEAPAEQYEKPKVEPAPPTVRSDDLPDPGSTQRAGSAVQFATLTRGQPETRHYGASASDELVRFKTAAPADGLGPKLTAAPVRRIISDDKTPWVVGDSGNVREPEDTEAAPHKKRFHTRKGSHKKRFQGSLIAQGVQ